MDADVIAVAQRLADGVDALKAKRRGIERVDALFRASARVGGNARVAHGLCHAAVLTALAVKIAVGARAGVEHI